jgi:glycolate oxidase iron-sulfur subunit
MIETKSGMEPSAKDKYQEKLLKLTHDAANQCVQCGYCLPACPTYESMGRESQSPRGRINLVKMAAEGKIDILNDLAKPIDLCLGCRACEVVCPVNVPYGQIYEGAKEVITEKQMDEQGKHGSSLQLKMRNSTLKHLIPHKKRLRVVGNLAWFYQKTGLNKLAHKTKVIDKISEPMAQIEKVLPPLESPLKRSNDRKVFPSKGEKKARVAFFSGCIMDAMMSKTNRLTIELLQTAGCEVVIPNQQNCCGALHAHQGLTDESRKLAKANIKAFEESGADYYINNAGGCGAALCEYDHLLKAESDWMDRARVFVKKSKDISELLVKLGPLPFKKEWMGMITYQDSCHLRNVQGIWNEPRELLRSIPGATYIEMEGSDRCCGSGGIYNILNFDESMNILDEKMIKAQKTNATTIVTSNPGCLLQMKLGGERSGLSNRVEVLHIVEVLADVCGIK